MMQVCHSSASVDSAVRLWRLKDLIAFVRVLPTIVSSKTEIDILFSAEMDVSEDMSSMH